MSCTTIMRNHSISTPPVPYDRNKNVNGKKTKKSQRIENEFYMVARKGATIPTPNYTPGLSEGPGASIAAHPG